MPHSRLASPSATIGVLKRHGLYTRKSLGQHFLIDDNIVGRIVETAAIEPGEPVLEIGPGIGTLTDALLSAGASVVAVEYDTRLLPVLAALEAEYRLAFGRACRCGVGARGPARDARRSSPGARGEPPVRRRGHGRVAVLRGAARARARGRDGSGRGGRSDGGRPGEQGVRRLHRQARTPCHRRRAIRRAPLVLPASAARGLYGHPTRSCRARAA